MQEHTVEKVSHWPVAHIALEALRVAVNIEVLDGDLGLVSHLLSTVRAAGRQGDPGVAAGAAV